MTTSMHPQAGKVLDIIRRDGHITRLTAMHYGISNLTARIADLRIRHQLPIVCVKKRDAEGTEYGSWKILELEEGARVIVKYEDPNDENNDYIKDGARGMIARVDDVGLYVIPTDGQSSMFLHGKGWWVRRADVKLV